jgi:hypothetical protein
MDFRVKALYLAQRISVSFGQKQENRPQGLNHQIEKALAVLGQYSSNEAGQENPLKELLTELEAKLAESSDTNSVLQRRVQEQDEELQAISTRVAERDQTLQELSIQLANKDVRVEESSKHTAKENETAQMLSSQLAEKDRTIQTLSEISEQELGMLSRAQRDAERIGVLSAQLLETETQLKSIRNTLGWRLLSQYGRIKYRYLLPVYELFRQAPTEPKSKSTDE